MSTISGINLENTKYNITLPLLASGFTTTAGSSTSGSYLATKWAVANVNGITTPVDGMTIAVRVPLAGNSGGVLLSIDGGTKYYPIVRNVNTLVTTNYAVGATIILTFNSTQKASPYLTAGTTTSVTGCWQIADYDGDTKVTQTARTTNGEFPILLRGTSAGTSTTTTTTTFGAGVTVNPSTKTVTATTFKGTATKATQDGNGNIITDTYAPIDSPAFTTSVSMGRKSGTTVGENSTALGIEVTASGKYSHAEGAFTTASGQYSHAEGGETVASGYYAHAEGFKTTANKINSHAEGGETEASGNFSHAEGGHTTASGQYSHAEGSASIAGGEGSHAEGGNTEASGNFSHAEGAYTIASGYSSHAEGYETIAKGHYQHVQGKYNIIDEEGDNGVYAHIVGKGTSDTYRSNAHTLDWSGNAWFAGDVYVGGTNQTTGSSKLAKEGHNQASSTINKMTGYSKPSSTSAIATSDTLNAAIGKLEKALDGKGTSSLTIGTTSTTAAAGNHTHSTYAPKASPTLTGTPKAPTAAAGTNTTQIATTAFVQKALSSIDGVFIGTYNSTTFAEFNAAYKSGKALFVVHSALNRVYTMISATPDSYYGFVSWDGDTCSTMGISTTGWTLQNQGHAIQHSIYGNDPITPADIGAAPEYTYSTTDLTAGTSALETGKLYFVYE